MGGNVHFFGDCSFFTLIFFVFLTLARPTLGLAWAREKDRATTVAISNPGTVPAFSSGVVFKDGSASSSEDVSSGSVGYSLGGFGSFLLFWLGGGGGSEAAAIR